MIDVENAHITKCQTNSSHAEMRFSWTLIFYGMNQIAAYAGKAVVDFTSKIKSQMNVRALCESMINNPYKRKGEGELICAGLAIGRAEYVQMPDFVFAQ